MSKPWYVRPRMAPTIYACSFASAAVGMEATTTRLGIFFDAQRTDARVHRARFHHPCCRLAFADTVSCCRLQQMNLKPPAAVLLLLLK